MVMNKKRIAFINESSKRVNEALKKISKLGELAGNPKYQYTDSELDQIFAALHAEVAHVYAGFQGASKRSPQNFRLSRLDSAKRRGDSRATEPWLETFESLTARRDSANQALRKKRSKPVATDKNADRLMSAISKALHLPVKPANVSPREWALKSGANVVVLDAKKVAQTFRPTLAKAPQSMIKGRLKVITKFASEVSTIQVVRAPKGLKLPKSVDSKYAVMLFKVGN